MNIKDMPQIHSTISDIILHQRTTTINPTRSGKESKSILNSNNTALTGKDKRVIHSTDDPKLVVRQTTLYQKVNQFKTSFWHRARHATMRHMWSSWYTRSIHITIEGGQYGRRGVEHPRVIDDPWLRRAINKKIILLFVLGIHSFPDMNSVIEKESQQSSKVIFVTLM